MKLFFCTTLLLAISFFTSSCKTKQDLVIKEHYQSVNKYSTLENKLLRDNNALLLSTSISKSNNQDYDNSVNLQMYQSQVNSSEYKVLYDDSEIANGDVYKEAAAHRQILIDKAGNKEKDCNCGSTNTKTTVNANSVNTVTAATPTANVNTKASSTTSDVKPATTKANVLANSNTKVTVDTKKSPTVKTSNTQPATKPTVKATGNTKTQPSVNSGKTTTNNAVAAKETKVAEVRTPDFFAILTDIDKKAIQKVGISHVDDDDRLLLKDYSVVIASFSQPDNLASLKKALTSSVDKLFFVKNDAGVYYAIFGSYKTENEALQKLKRIRMEYTNLYTTQQLNDKYGITFTDLYILKR